MTINITTTHTITCDNAPVEDVYRELDEEFPQLNPIIGQKLRLREERDDARKSNHTLLTLNDSLKIKVAELTRELEETQDALVKTTKKYIINRPALPEGMRIAERENYGRVIVSPCTASDRYYRVFALDDGTLYKADCFYTEPSTLTFLDDEPAPAPLPKPEDCKEGELYLARAFGRSVVANRCDPRDEHSPWIVSATDDKYADWCKDSQVTLLARLLPDREVK